MQQHSYNPYGHTHGQVGTGGAPLHYNPYRHMMPNPLTRRQKVNIGTAAGVGLVAVLAIIFWPGSAKAAQTAVVPEPPETKPKKPGGSTPSKPPGNPPNPAGGDYDTAFWDAGGTAAARQRIFDAFTALGYSTPADRDTMNDPGGDRKLGGGDDVPNSEVRRFQSDYNAVSRSGLLGSNMGGLWQDGMLGVNTLNGLRYVLLNVGVMSPFTADDQLGPSWRSLVQQARS